MLSKYVKVGFYRFLIYIYIGFSFSSCAVKREGFDVLKTTFHVSDAGVRRAGFQQLRRDHRVIRTKIASAVA